MTQKDKTIGRQVLDAVLDYTPIVGLVTSNKSDRFFKEGFNGVTVAVLISFFGLSSLNTFRDSKLSNGLFPPQKEITNAIIERDKNSLVQAIGEKYDFNGDGVLSRGELLIAREAVEGKLNKTYQDALKGFSQAELEYLANQGERK